jgi:inorganic triphosphatase YgiF
VTGPAIESELKLIADGEAPLSWLATRARLGRARLGPPRTVEELDRYLDTAGRRLASEGWACRLRTRQGSTTVSLKGPAEHREGAVLHRRPELNGPATVRAAPSGWPPSEARDLLDAMSGGEPLVERLTLVQARTEREVVMHGRRAGTLSLDRVKVVAGGVELGLLHIVELELDPTTVPVAPDADHLSEALERIDGLRRDPMTKLQHALDMIARADP